MTTLTLTPRLNARSTTHFGYFTDYAPLGFEDRNGTQR
jgi:hypothetical protein